MEIDERVLEFDMRVLPLGMDELVVLCEHMKIAKSLTDGKTKLAIIKVIRSTMENDVAGLEEEDTITEYFGRLEKFFADLAKGKSNETSKDKEKPSEQQPQTSPSPKLVDLNSLTRRDFKIIGQIGDPGQKDKLLFQSLVSQIQNGKKKSYTDPEIVAAVIRAVQPGMPLRAYLEGIPDITLARLRKILRCHFREKTATELYQVLANLTQQQKEDPQSFLIRALTVRQQICFASQEADSPIKYDNTLVQGLFLHTVETGLLDETIRSKIRPILQHPKASDEDLLEAMGRAMAEEHERGKKLCRGKAKVASVTEDESALTTGKEKEVKPQQDHVWAALKSVQSQLESVQSQMSALQTATHQEKSEGEKPRDGYSRRPLAQRNRASNRGCPDCVETRSQCNHCFLCGGINHFARDCQSRSNPNQGNGRWLPPRGQK